MFVARKLHLLKHESSANRYECKTLQENLVFYWKFRLKVYWPRLKVNLKTIHECLQLIWNEWIFGDSRQQNEALLINLQWFYLFKIHQPFSVYFQEMLYEWNFSLWIASWSLVEATWKFMKYLYIFPFFSCRAYLYIQRFHRQNIHEPVDKMLKKSFCLT